MEYNVHLGGESALDFAGYAHLLREVQRERFPAAYWQHLQFHLGRCEDYWQRE